MREIERHITLREIDRAWVDHLTNMDYLREGIGLRGYAQVDPLVAYKKEALQLFDRMQADIQGNVIRNLFMASVQPEQPLPEESLFRAISEFGPMDGNFDGETVYMDENGNPIELPASAMMMQDVGQSALLAAAAASAQQSSATAAKIAPDDPCPCGSGKKYKHCHRNRPLP